ncbi:hypothetical protein A2U01_0054018, partial [Trifolium medium]|nr:hypothetical protein [Trifolium medium]
LQSGPMWQYHEFSLDVYCAICSYTSCPPTLANKQHKFLASVLELGGSF